MKVPIIGKKRCAIERENVLPNFKLSIKAKDSSKNKMEKKQCHEMKGTLGKGKNKLDLSPAWVESNLRDMASIINNTKKELKERRAELKQWSIEKAELKGEVWRNTISIKMGKFQAPNFTKWLK